MAIKLGSGNISKLYLGSTEITKAYLGATEVYTAGAPPVNNAFELTVETTTTNESFLLPMTGVTSIDVDWGDGTIDTGITADNPTHTYATAGTHSISVTGSATSVVFRNSGSESKLKTVTNLGALGWTSFVDAFGGTSNLTSFSSGDCDTSLITNITYMFIGSGATTIDLSTMDVSGVTNMGNGVFISCSNLTTCDLSTWEMSQVTRIDSMFRFCASLENMGFIANWDITSITNGNRFLDGANLALTTAEYDAVLIAWAAQAVQSNVTIDFGDATYTAGGAAEAARDTLESTYGWSITDGGPA